MQHLVTSAHLPSSRPAYVEATGLTYTYVSPTRFKQSRIGAIYQIEALLATRPRGSHQRQFLVRWSGYGAEDDSWEDEANILDNKMIKAFDRAAKGALPQPECAATSEYLARRVTHRSRVGTAHQVAELPQARELVGVHRGAQCGCARCVTLMAASGNGTAAHALPCAPPRCHCGAPAAWVRQLFLV